MKLELMIDSAALGSSGCSIKMGRTLFGDIDTSSLGGYKSTPKAAMIYGVACHKFFDVMFKTKGYFPVARKEAEKSFNIQKYNDDKKPWLSDPKHMMTTNYMIWENHIVNDATFDVLVVPIKCWWCGGSGIQFIIGASENDAIANKEYCKHCAGKGIVEGPATEITFKIKIFENEWVIVYLTGTIDRVGKFKGGCFAIRDYKTTSAWDKDDYLSQYELSRQMRVYRLACKLMAENEPESILGKVGAHNMGAAIDGIFLKPSANDVDFKMGPCRVFSKEEIDSFQSNLMEWLEWFLRKIETKNLTKDGILNGLCDGKWGKCDFWNVCKSNATVANVLLNRDFKRVIYNPLCFNQ